MKVPPRKKVTSAGAILDKIDEGHVNVRARVNEQTLNMRVAEMIYAAREASGLTQSDLARLLGTTQSVISRLEDADYDGHSLSMLRRIAEVLGQSLEVRFVPARERRRRPARGASAPKSSRGLRGGKSTR